MVSSPVEEPAREVDGDVVVEPLYVHGMERARLMSVYVFVVVYQAMGWEGAEFATGSWVEGASTFVGSLVTRKASERGASSRCPDSCLHAHPMWSILRIFIMMFLLRYAWVGTLVAMYFDPWVGVCNLLYAYYLDNLSFTFGHLVLHAKFIEWPEWAMDVLCKGLFGAIAGVL